MGRLKWHENTQKNGVEMRKSRKRGVWSIGRLKWDENTKKNGVNRFRNEEESKEGGVKYGSLEMTWEHKKEWCGSLRMTWDVEIWVAWNDMRKQKEKWIAWNMGRLKWYKMWLKSGSLQFPRNVEESMKTKARYGSLEIWVAWNDMRKLKGRCGSLEIWIAWNDTRCGE